MPEGDYLKKYWKRGNNKEPQSMKPFTVFALFTHESCSHLNLISDDRNSLSN